jgi:hypothetical protein
MPRIGLPARSGVGAPLPNPTGQSPRAAAAVSTALAEASRRNGAKSRGPKTPEGKARSARNALKHGLRAVRHLVLPAEDPAAFAALEKALLEEFAPEGAVQTVLARQVVSAAWRLARADRIEAEILMFRDRREGDLGLAVTRDANTARALPTLVRYRAAAHAELMRSLRTLQALQAEAAKAAAGAGEPAARRPAAVRAHEPAPALALAPAPRRAGPASRGGGSARSAPDPRASGGSARAEPRLAAPGAAPGQLFPGSRAPGGIPHPAPALRMPNEPEPGDPRGAAPAALAAQSGAPTTERTLSCGDAA